MEKSADWNTHICGERIANALRVIHPYATAKLISRDTGISQRTVERIIDGTGSPSLENFARMLAAYPSLLAALAPVVPWAPLAAAAVEQEVMQARLDQAHSERRRALDIMRGRR